MTALARKSKGFGFAGTLFAHGLILLACFFVVEEAVPTPLPLPVEALRISLTEPVAAPEPSPEPVPEPEPALPPEPEPPVPPVVEDPIPVRNKVAEKPKKKTPPKENRPRKEQAKPAPVQTVQPGPKAPVPDPAKRQARQTLLSALVARIEKEKRYPTAARRLGLEGKVTAVVRVDANGQIISVQVRAASAHTVLEKATQEALNRVRSKWKPVPVPEAMTLNIPIHYNLRS